MEADHDIVRAGKVRYIGASSMSAWPFAKLQHTLRAAMAGQDERAAGAWPALSPGWPRAGRADCRAGMGVLANSARACPVRQ
jgi:hypothetical protein